MSITFKFPFYFPTIYDLVLLDFGLSFKIACEDKKLEPSSKYTR
jgi:hypothetical protein